MIKPSPGRICWFVPNEIEERGFRLNTDQCCTAQIVYVVNDREVHAVVTTHEGIPVFMRNLKLIQEGDKIPDGSEEGTKRERYLMWMPYQVGQAKKSEADPDADLLKGKK